MNAIPNCPECESSYVYEDRELYICPECGYEFSKVSHGDDEEELVVYDANGTKLEDGDSVSIIKDLKVKNSSTVVKVGTKVKNIRLVDGDHNLDCKVPGIGQMGLKSEFVKKVTQ